MEEKSKNSAIFDEFWNIVEKGEENKKRLASTKTHELIQFLAEIYVGKGRVDAYIKIPEINAEYNLPRDYYKDLIDIYCLESQFDTSLSDAKIDLIEVIGAEFQDDAFEYLVNLAFKPCAEQDYALKLILNYSVILEPRKNYLNKVLRKNFHQLSEDLQNRTLSFYDAVGYDPKFISSLTKNRQKRKWWEFW